MLPRISPRNAALTPIVFAVLAATAALAAAPLRAASTPFPVPTIQPKAFAAVPGPDAEYLSLADRYTLRADGAVVHERRSRLQVNSYLAINRKYGETKVPYDPATDTFDVLVNRTLLPSGQVVEAPGNAVVDDQPAGAERDPLWSGLRRKVIVHTALEPGAVIEEAWRTTRAATAAPWIELAEPLALEPPVRARAIEVDLPSGTPLRWQVTGWLRTEPKRESAAGRDVWRWTLDTVQAFPPEPGVPPEPPSLIASTCPGREALAGEFDRRAANVGGDPDGLAALARQADAKNPGDEARIFAVLDAVAQAVAVAPITPSQQNWRPRPLADVWRAGVATPLELAALQAAALRAVGFSTTWAAVAGGDERDVEKCPAMAGLDRALVMVRWASEGTRFYDPVKARRGRAPRSDHERGERHCHPCSRRDAGDARMAPRKQAVGGPGDRGRARRRSERNGRVRRDRRTHPPRRACARPREVRPRACRLCCRTARPRTQGSRSCAAAARRSLPRSKGSSQPRTPWASCAGRCRTFRAESRASSRRPPHRGVCRRFPSRRPAVRPSSWSWRSRRDGRSRRSPLLQRSATTPGPWRRAARSSRMAASGSRARSSSAVRSSRQRKPRRPARS